jgi:hypothetical protein
MTGNMWIDLQMSLADIEAEIPPTCLASYPAYLPWVMHESTWAAMTMHSTSTACLAVRALSRRWPRGRFPDASVRLAG